MNPMLDCLHCASSHLEVVRVEFEGRAALRSDYRLTTWFRGNLRWALVATISVRYSGLVNGAGGPETLSAQEVGVHEVFYQMGGTKGYLFNVGCAPPPFGPSFRSCAPDDFIHPFADSSPSTTLTYFRQPGGAKMVGAGLATLICRVD